MAQKTRQPIVSVMGHVDHGKTTLLDHIRGSTVTEREAGAITQAIGASIIPMHVIQKRCGKLLDTLGIKFTIPGLLFIDTPGHAAFTSLRKRGGSLADIVILVIDINEGVMPQTEEAIEILKQSKTPFIIAANKMDTLGGWKSSEGTLLQQVEKQEQSFITVFETRLYQIVTKLSELGLNADRFDRVSDYTKQVALIPTIARQGVGVAELLMVLMGLAQKFLEQNLKINVEGDAKASILEVAEEKGLGKTIDIILYDGTLKKGDTIVIGTLGEPVTAKIRALLEPKPLQEMMDIKSKYDHVQEVSAATGVKLSSPDFTDDIVAGMPVLGVREQTIEQAKQEVKKEVSEVLIETDEDGVIIKANNLGSLEALITLLRQEEVPIRKATIGEISKKDLAEAESVHEKDPLLSVVLGFNVGVKEKVPGTVKVITGDIIYKILEQYKEWQEAEKKKIEAKKIEGLVRPCKVQILENYVFRQSNPAIVGSEVLGGTLKTGMPLMKDGPTLTTVKEIQAEKEKLQKVEKGKQVAISLPGVTVGRQIHEGDVLYSAIPESDFRELKNLKEYLTPDEREVIKEIAQIMRKQNPVWGI
jgi:translation initiation factor 5B